MILVNLMITQQIVIVNMKMLLYLFLKSLSGTVIKNALMTYEGGRLRAKRELLQR